VTDPLPPLSAGTAWSRWIVEPVGTTVAVLAAIGYLIGVLAVRRTGARWPAGRSAWFAAGVVLLVISTDSAIGAYSHALFWMHMVQHLLLITVVPALLVLGHPISLLEGTGPAGRRVVRALRRSGPVSLITNPVTALALYTAVLVATHLTRYMQLMPSHIWMHSLEVGLYLVSGYLLLQILLVHEPIRWDPPYPVRLGLLFVSMIVDAGVGVSLMMAGTDPFPGFAAARPGWGPAALDDVHIGGAVMWAGGDGLMMLAIVAVAAHWITDTERQNDMGTVLESVRRSTIAGLLTEIRPGSAESADSAVIRASRNVDDDEQAYQAYNRMLAKLAESERHPDSAPP
jgi:putative copper resistance protein D